MRQIPVQAEFGVAALRRHKRFKAIEHLAISLT
jgi:hypothetical protein